MNEIPAAGSTYAAIRPKLPMSRSGIYKVSKERVKLRAEIGNH